MTRAAVCAVVIATALSMIATPAAHGSFPGRNGLIAVGGYGFSFECRDTPSIHVMRSDGSGLRPLSPRKCRAQQWAPDWSADGRSLAFADFHGLGVMSADGSQVRHVPLPAGACACGSDLEPSISPDGQRAVFAASDGVREKIWMAAFDGSGTHAILPGASPRWSPDGRVIAYVTPAGRLGLLDALTERPIVVRGFSQAVWSVDWSPDGRRLVLEMEPRHGFHNVLARLDAADATSAPVRIVLPRRFRSRLEVHDPVWSPDGRRMAFLAYRRLDPETIRATLWVMRAGGGHLRRIVRRGGLAGDTIPDSLSWQPVVP
jgi:Tol biopolymer transport system component